MKHFLFILFVIVVGYAIWQFADPVERRATLRVVMHHLVRLGLLVLAAFGFLAAAIHLQSTPLF